MILDYSKIEETRIPKMREGLGELISKRFQDENCKILYGKLEPGSTIGFHTHETDSEAIYILSGTADILYDDGREVVEAGNCHYCPMGHSHSMRNLGTEDLIFFAVVPKHHS